MARFTLVVALFICATCTTWAQPLAKKDALSYDDARRLLLSVAPAAIEPGQAIDAVAFAPDGKTIVTVSNEAGKVFHWDALSGKMLRQWGMPQGRFERSTLSAGGQVVAVTDGGGLVSLWDATTGKKLHILKDAAGPTLALAPDGKSVVAGLADGALGVWDVSSGKLRGKLPNSVWTAGLALAFSGDGKHIAAPRPDTTVGVWDAQTTKEVASLPVGTPDVNMLAFAPGGKKLASVTGNGVVKLWDVATKKARREMQLPPGHHVTSGFFTPDGRSLVTGGGDGAMRVLEVASGKERHAFPALQGRVTCAALSPDGRMLVTGARNNQALVRTTVGAGPGEGQIALAAPPKDAEQAWAHLGGDDPARALRARDSLTKDPKAMALLEKHLKPAKGMDKEKIAQLIKDLDSDKFAVREKAKKELARFGEAAEIALEAALRDEPTLEARKRLEGLLDRLRGQSLPPDRLLIARAIEVLEMSASPQARQILRTLAGGAADDPLTQDARAALERLKGK